MTAPMAWAISTGRRVPAPVGGAAASLWIMVSGIGDLLEAGQGAKDGVEHVGGGGILAGRGEGDAGHHSPSPISARTSSASTSSETRSTSSEMKGLKASILAATSPRVVGR